MATYIFRYGTEGLGLNITQVAERLNRNPGSISRRLENYRYAETQGGEGLSGWNPARIREIYADLAQLTGRNPGTILDHFAGFLNHDGIEAGRRNGDQLAHEVYEAHRSMAREEIRRAAVQALLNLARSAR